jgi:hypothetical protein
LQELLSAPEAPEWSMAGGIQDVLESIVAAFAGIFGGLASGLGGAFGQPGMVGILPSFYKYIYL